MSTTSSPKAPRVRQTRKSIAHMPSSNLGGDKENATMDSAALSSIATQSKDKTKKSRSKSIGPGGLDALKEGSGNRGEPTPRPFVKSILKTTVQLSPPKPIPQRNTSGNLSPNRTSDRIRNSPQRSPSRKAGDGSQSPGGTRGVGSRASQSPSRSPTRVAVRTEEEQQEAAREREQQEKLAQKEARRKSLANRRVSFAPEATLHTWNVVELPEDSTTSSASTNSTRRASGLTGNAGSLPTTPRSPLPSSDPSEPPSTPPEQVEELQVAASPAHQRDLHQKKRRRSSTVPPMNFNDPNDFSSSPASIISDDSGSRTFDNVDEEIDSSDSDDKDLEEDETVTAVDADDSTTQSAGASSTGSSERLEAALAQAAKQAGTQGIDYDEHGDMSMDMAEEEVTDAFKPWMANVRQPTQIASGQEAFQDQENVNPFLASPNPSLGNEATHSIGEGTMEMTKPVGKILSSEEAPTSPKRGKRKSMAGRRRSSMAPRRSSGDESTLAEDETMDLTMAVGGIQPDNEEGSDNDEEMTMEFTSVVGGVVQPDKNNESTANQSFSRRESSDSTMNGEDMDMTFAGGGILPPITETTEPIEDQTMDFTSAIGGVLPKELSTSNKTEAKTLMEMEADVGQLSASPFHAGTPQKPMGSGLNDERPLPAHVHKTTLASETGSPSLAASQSRPPSRRSTGDRKSTTPKSVEKQPTPVKKPATPTKQVTPQAARPTIPEKTPPSKNVTMRSASPKKLFKKEIKANKTENSTPKSDSKNPLFKRDAVTGTTTPSIILKPRKRRSSGLGADREGLGSPRVTELLDRRGSIGEKAKVFVPQGKTGESVRFENPQAIEREIDQERREEERRESGRAILEDEADMQDLNEPKDITTSLKDMIGSLTPQKKNKLKGRKSLHVGAAKGLLGKRPPELDEDDDEEDSTKRLRGREGSPVKKVKLPAPPSKDSTTGRITRSNRRSLVETDGNVQAGTPSGRLSPSKENTTPKDQPRFKDVDAQSPEKIPSFGQKLERSPEVTEPSEEEDRIHLQDFLNMTNIRFIELTTTKRRHTVVPNAMGDQVEKEPKENEQNEETSIKNDLESRVVAGTCTVPMLELYQHSCRELKNYISEGRSIVKEIEADTYEENPPLFREYMSAPADVKPIMDNQFKNVKSHARLLSKAMWYEWRMKLLEGLREGLLKIGEDMEQDHLCLTQQEQIIQPILPGLIEEHEQLESQANIAQTQADELADCDQEELKYVRESLVEVEDDLEEKQRLVEDLQNQLREKEDRLEAVISSKQEYLEEIKEAEKVLQDCRGWSLSEVASLQANIDDLESEYGWTVSGISGSALNMTYNRALQLFFTPSSFAPNKRDLAPTEDKENQPISLTYIGDSRPHHAETLTTEKRFFLQIMRAQLQCLSQSQIRIKNLLSYISRSWDLACAVAEEARALGVNYITEAAITSDEAMAVKSFILLPSMHTKVEVGFEVRARSTPVPNTGDGVSELRLSPLDVIVKPTTKVWYGDLKEGKMSEFLETRIRGFKLGRGNGGGTKENGKSKEDQASGAWTRAVAELEERCLARGKK